MDGWVAALGLTLIVTFSLSWVAAVTGLLGGSVEVVQQLGLLIFLPILASNAFVPASTMPSWLRWFVENQPFTQAIDAVRELLLNQPLGDHLLLSLVWFLGITAGAFAAATYLFQRIAAIS